MSIDPQEAFAETLAALHGERTAKLTFNRKKAQPRFEKGLINLSDFKQNYNRTAAHAAYDARFIVVTLGNNFEPVFVVAPETKLALPTEAKFIATADHQFVGEFLSMSLPEKHAAKYRAERTQYDHLPNHYPAALHLDRILSIFGGEPLGPNVFWRREYPEAGAVIIAQYGTVKPRSTAPQPH